METVKMNKAKSASEVFGMLSRKDNKKLSVQQMNYYLKRAAIAGGEFKEF